MDLSKILDDMGMPIVEFAHENTGPVAGEMLDNALQVRVEPQDAGYSVEVLSGMDRGLRGSVGDSLSLSEFGVNVHVDFEVGPRLVPGDGVVMLLEGQKVAVAVELLQGDVLTVGGKTVKVLA